MNRDKAVCWIIITWVAFALPAWSVEPEVCLVPWPQSLTLTGGDMGLTASTRVVYSDASLLPLAQIVAEEIEAVTRLNVSVASGSPSPGDINLKLTTDPTITGEAYRVTVAQYATAEAANYNAVAMGSVTLLQAIKVHASSYSIAKMTVADAPDAEYRGYMVDVARQYHSIDTLKEIVIMCRLYKIRYLQLHLTDDQAFTFPTTAYPTLAAHGSDYSMAEFKDLVTFADQRGVILIPELEVPAHASCFTNAMPDLFASPTNGIINFADPAVWGAVKTIIDEMCDVFQSTPYFHLGADEANIWGLSRDLKFKAAFETYGVQGIEGLFNRFINELNDKVKSRGKKTIVWEGFNYGLTGNSKMDPDIMVMMFDNYKQSQAYMDAGHKVINASWFPLYIVGGSGFGVPANLIYDWDRYQFGNYTDPFPRRYDSVTWKNVSPTPDVPGAQMCAWEMPEKNEIPFARFRIAPYADRIWNPANAHGFEHFDPRYDSTDIILDYLLADRQPAGIPIKVGASDGLYEDRIRIGWATGGNYPVRLALYRNTTNHSATATLIADEMSKETTSYEDTNVVKGRTYYYWVAAQNNWGSSPFSAVATGRTGTSSDWPLAYEPFDYSGGVAIDDQDGGSGFTTPWSLDASNGTATVDPAGLIYQGLVTDGGALKFTSATDKPSFELSRSFSGHAGHDMSVVWFSFLIKPEKVAEGHAYIMLNSQFGGTGIGKKWGNGFGFHGISSVKLENNQTYFVVARYDCRSGNDVAHLWVNPSLDQAPALNTANVTYTGGDIGFGHSIDFSVQGYGKGVTIYDEIRVGATWRNVIGVSALDPAAKAFDRAMAHVKTLPDPPAGFKWAVNPDFTDEFEGRQLNAKKWYDKSPYWKNGRPPATFKASNVSLEDGCLRIKNSRLDPTEGNDGKPGTKYSLAGGAVASKSDQAWYGYYETRMKASPTPMSSTFWLKNLSQEIQYVDEQGKLITEYHRQELDIIETMGTPTRFANWGRQFNANTHYGLKVKGGQSPPNVSVGSPGDGRAAIEPSSEAFHTYGLWWVDANTMHCYYDGKFLFTIHPSTKYNAKPFARPMYMHLVTETYAWEPSLPTDDMLNDDTQNSTLYDWVRSYVLVRKDAK